jgi:hypothetical protein
MPSGNEHTMKARLVAEGKTIAFLFVYLAFLLTAFATYRSLVLAEYENIYVKYGAPIIESLLLAKIISIGRFLRLGEGRFRNHALVVISVYKAVVFSIFSVAFFLLEHLVTGWLRGKSSTLIFQEILSQTIWEIVAKVVVLFVAFIPLFAIWEMGSALGESNLFDLFFKRNTVEPRRKSDREFGSAA